MFFHEVPQKLVMSGGKFKIEREESDDIHVIAVQFYNVSEYMMQYLPPRIFIEKTLAGWHLCSFKEISVESKNTTWKTLCPCYRF